MDSKELIQQIADELKAIVECKEENGDEISKSEIDYIRRLMLDVRHKAGQTLTAFGAQEVARKLGV